MPGVTNVNAMHMWCYHSYTCVYILMLGEET